LGHRWHMHWEKVLYYQEKGKLPYKTISVEYELEYGTDILEMHIDAIKKGQRVVIVDDLLATGELQNRI